MKKKMRTKKKEGNEFSLMKFVQMARVGFRDCHTRWFSKKKIRTWSCYVCMFLVLSLLSLKNTNILYFSEKSPLWLLLPLCFRTSVLATNPVQLCQSFLLTYFYNTLQQNDSKMRQCIYIKRECCCISIIVIDLINVIGPGPHSHNALFWSDFDDLSGV